jgi:hypothetical protein
VGEANVELLNGYVRIEERITFGEETKVILV